jgi:hypothetical protein
MQLSIYSFTNTTIKLYINPSTNQLYCPPIYSSIHLSIDFLMYSVTCSSTHSLTNSFTFIHFLSFFPVTCFFIYLSKNSPMNSPIYPPTHPQIYLFNFSISQLPIHQYSYPPTYPSIHSSVRPFIHPSNTY